MMANEEVTPVRVWKWFRDGFNIYISKPLNIMTFLAVISGKVPWITESLGYWPSQVVGLVVLSLASVSVGWVHWRLFNIPGKENVMTVESNQVQCHNRRVSMQHTLKIMDALNIEPSQEWLNLYEFWEYWDGRWMWKP